VDSFSCLKTKQCRPKCAAESVQPHSRIQIQAWAAWLKLSSAVATGIAASDVELSIDASVRLSSLSRPQFGLRRILIRPKLGRYMRVTTQNRTRVYFLVKKTLIGCSVSRMLAHVVCQTAKHACTRLKTIAALGAGNAYKSANGVDRAQGSIYQHTTISIRPYFREGPHQPARSLSSSYLLLNLEWLPYMFVIVELRRSL